ncbi:MAG: hypothetical protein IJO81_02235 [Clostridia bacterium]|nr:hypothetical protein [Clostridia bacterium]
MIPVYLLLAEIDFYFCLKYFLGLSAGKGDFRSIANGISMAASSAVLILYVCEFTVCSGLGVVCIYTIHTGTVLFWWAAAYLAFRAVYIGVTDVIDKKRREDAPMWLLDEDVLLKGRVRDGKFYPESDKCGFYSQTIDCTMYGRTLFLNLEEAVSICGELPVVDADTYKDE